MMMLVAAVVLVTLPLVWRLRPFLRKVGQPPAPTAWGDGGGA